MNLFALRKANLDPAVFSDEQISPARSINYYFPVLS
jgi:hypothetical protein